MRSFHRLFCASEFLQNCRVKIVQVLDLRYVWRDLMLAVHGLNGTLSWTSTATMKSVSLAPVVAAWTAAGLPGLSGMVSPQPP